MTNRTYTVPEHMNTADKIRWINLCIPPHHEAVFYDGKTLSCMCTELAKAPIDFPGWLVDMLDELAPGGSISFFVRPSPPLKTPLDFDWSIVPPWFWGIYQAPNGVWVMTETVPLRTSYNFRPRGRCTVRIPSEYAPKNYTGRWEDSARKRPPYKAAVDRIQPGMSHLT